MNGSQRQDASILMYHSVSDDASAKSFARFVHTREAFEAHLAYLAASDYRVVTASALARAPQDEKLVALTFDDGFRDFHATVLPLLVKYQLPASLYVPTAYIGGSARWLAPDCEDDRPVLGWPELIDISQSPLVEIGAHSHTHPQLDRVDIARVRAESTLPKLILEDHLQLPIRGFAYPFGYHDRRARKAVADAGYEYAVAVDEMRARTVDDCRALPRLTVNSGTTVEQLAALLAASTNPGARLLSGCKRQLWRACRRVAEAARAGRQDRRE